MVAIQPTKCCSVALCDDPRAAMHGQNIVAMSLQHGRTQQISRSLVEDTKLFSGTAESEYHYSNAAEQSYTMGQVNQISHFEE